MVRGNWLTRGIRLLLGLAALTVAGCGGGDADDGASAQAFVARIQEALAVHTNDGPVAAEEHYRAALQIGARLDAETRAEHAAWLAIAHNGVGEALLARGEALEGVRAIERAEREIEDLPDDYQSMLLSLLGELLIELGLPERADEPIDRALVLAQPLPGQKPNYGVWFNAYLRRIRQYLAVGRFRDAAEAAEICRQDYPWEAAREVIEETRYTNNRGTLEVVAGTAWMEVALDEPELTARAIEAFERVGPGCRPLDRFTAEGRLAHLELRAGSIDAAATRLGALRSRTDAGEFGALSPKELTWLVSLEARAAELAHGDRAAARANLEAAFASLLDRWRDSSRPGGTGFLRYGRARLVVEQLVALGNEEQALEVALQYATCGVLWDAFGRPQPALAEVRSSLTGDSVGCLVYLLGADRSFVLAFDQHQVMRHELTAPRHLSRDADEFMRALRQTPTALSPGARKRRDSDLEAHGAQLEQDLFPAALRTWIETKHHLRIVGAEGLSGLAFEALRLRGEPLGYSHALSYLPSLTIGVALAERRQERGPVGDGVRLIVAPSLAKGMRDRFPSLLPLVLPPSTLGPLCNALGAREEDVWRRERATTSALAAARGDGVGVVHLIAHGVQDFTRELRPVVLLASDRRSPTGELGVEAVRRLDVPDLVVLSSCRVGRGAERFGDVGAAHLGGAFLQAGASCVVLSGEDLRLGAALAFAEHFHREYRGGASVAEALRLARVGFRDWRYGDPYDWALLHAFGLDVVER